jgi:hypothetical protein
MIRRFHVYSPAEIAFFEPIDRHFKVRIPAKTDLTSMARIDRIAGTYRRIQQALARMPANLAGNPARPVKAEAPFGGMDHAGSVITIGYDFVNSSPFMRAAVLVHEAAHFVDPICSHAASEMPPPNGTALTDPWAKSVNPAGRNYAQLDYGLAIQNAYSYAQCALHNGVGYDKRPA